MASCLEWLSPFLAYWAQLPSPWPQSFCRMRCHSQPVLWYTSLPMTFCPRRIQGKSQCDPHIASVRHFLSTFLRIFSSSMATQWQWFTGYMGNNRWFHYNDVPWCRIGIKADCVPTTNYEHLAPILIPNSVIMHFIFWLIGSVLCSATQSINSQSVRSINTTELLKLNNFIAFQSCLRLPWYPSFPSIRLNMLKTCVVLERLSYSYWRVGRLHDLHITHIVEHTNNV